MPLQIHPYFRSLQIKVLEPSGIFKTLNSTGYSAQLATEQANGVAAPPADLFKFVVYAGSKTELTLP